MLGRIGRALKKIPRAERFLLLAGALRRQLKKRHSIKTTLNAHARPSTAGQTDSGTHRPYEFAENFDGKRHSRGPLPRYRLRGRTSDRTLRVGLGCRPGSGGGPIRYAGESGGGRSLDRRPE